MTDATWFWLLLYAVAAFLFFGTAVVITIIGLQDLRDLLSKSERKNK